MFTVWEMVYVRIGTCISFFSQLHLCVICLRFVRSCMKDWYMFVLGFFLVVLGLNACPCEFLYMYISVVSEGLMEDKLLLNVSPSWNKVYYYYYYYYYFNSVNLVTVKFRAQLFKTNDIVSKRFVKIYIEWYANMLKFFAEKNVSSLQKLLMWVACKSYSHFFSKKNQNIVHWIL